MDSSIPRGAAIILDFLAQHESQGRYDVVFGHHERDLKMPITALSLDALGDVQRMLGKKWGSSAAGRYQFITSTIIGLRLKLKLTGKELFEPNLQDRLAYELLKQRGYPRFKAKTLSVEAFALNLAKEWASLPVLVATQGAHRRIAAGETFYAGDKLNRALVTPDTMRQLLVRAGTAVN